MKKILLPLLLLSCLITTACTSDTQKDSNTAGSSSKQFVHFSVDGKEFSIQDQDISTSYQGEGSATPVLKIFAGAENQPSLTITIPHAITTTSSTPSGSKEPGNAIAQGSVSLQGYPENGFVFNSYDIFVDPKPEPIKDAVVVTESRTAGSVTTIVGTISVTLLDDTSTGKKLTGTFSVNNG